MEENTIEQTDFISSLPEAQIKEIAAKVKSLRDADPKLKAIFPIVVEGNPEYDEKDAYIGYFRQPSFSVFSKYLAAAQKDQAVAMRNLAKDCFLAGDREMIDDDSLFIFGLMSQLYKVIEMRHGGLVNLSKPGK